MGSARKQPSGQQRAQTGKTQAGAPASGANDTPKRLSPEQRQMILAVSIGLFMGLLLAWLAGFWMWIPAGITVGLATGAIMKPPADKR